jgi:hypothetical protein
MKNKNLLFVIFLVSILVTQSFFLVNQVIATQQPTNNNSASTQTKKPKTKNISKKKTAAKEEVLEEMPNLGDRLNEQRLAIRRGEQRETSQPYLIDEISVNGIYKSVEGYGAFLKAVNGRLFFGYSGMLFYDGEILQIDADQVIFEQTLANGKKKQIIKAYDPSALRNTALEKEEKNKQETKKPKKKVVQEDEESEDAGTKDE